MLLMMLDRGERVDNILFGDTGVEYPEIYDWLERIEVLTGRHIERIPPRRSWDEGFYQIIKQGKHAGEIQGFAYVINKGCWFQRDKTYALDQRHIKDHAVACLGIGTNEAHRADREAYKRPKRGILYRFPLIEYGVTEDDCKEYLKSRGLIHPLNGRRSGCWMCPKQPRASLEWLMETHPDLWERLRVYERDCPHGFKPKYTLDEVTAEVATYKLWLEKLSRK
jgi:3'-phosphoadenosine 5'-phosphosulfate sulfotransferase (PAPS reductase)/FAD synthetase